MITHYLNFNLTNRKSKESTHAWALQLCWCRGPHFAGPIHTRDHSKQQTNKQTAAKSTKPAPLHHSIAAPPYHRGPRKPPTSATRLPLCITNDFINFQITESQRPAEHFVAFLWHSTQQQIGLMSSVFFRFIFWRRWALWEKSQSQMPKNAPEFGARLQRIAQGGPR